MKSQKIKFRHRRKTKQSSQFQQQSPQQQQQYQTSDQQPQAPQPNQTQNKKQREQGASSYSYLMPNKPQNKSQSQNRKNKQQKKQRSKQRQRGEKERLEKKQRISENDMEYLLKENLHVEEAKNMLKKLSDDDGFRALAEPAGAHGYWGLTDFGQVQWREYEATNQVRKYLFNNHQYSTVQSPITQPIISATLAVTAPTTNKNATLSANQLKARQKINIINKHQNINRDIFQNKQQFFNQKKKSYLDALHIRNNSNQRSLGQRRLNKNMSIGDIGELGRENQENNQRTQKTQKLAYLQSDFFQKLQKSNKKTLTRSTTTTDKNKRARIVLVTPQIKLHSKTQHQQQFLPAQQKQAYLSTVQLKMPQFRPKKIKTKKAITLHNDTQPARDMFRIVPNLGSIPNLNVGGNNSNQNNKSKNKSESKITNNKFYLQKTKTICVLEKPMQESNKYISLSNYVNCIHANHQNKGTLNRITNISQIMRKNKMNKTSKMPKVTQQQKQPSKPRQGSPSQNRQGRDNICMQVNSHTILTQYENFQVDSNYNTNKNSNSNTNSKTMYLRNQFERLRRLLNKEMKPDFKVDTDSPIRITKI